MPRTASFPEVDADRLPLLHGARDNDRCLVSHEIVTDAKARKAALEQNVERAR